MKKCNTTLVLRQCKRSALRYAPRGCLRFGPWRPARGSGQSTAPRWRVCRWRIGPRHSSRRGSQRRNPRRRPSRYLSAGRRRRVVRTPTEGQRPIADCHLLGVDPVVLHTGAVGVVCAQCLAVLGFSHHKKKRHASLEHSSYSEGTKMMWCLDRLPVTLAVGTEPVVGQLCTSLPITSNCRVNGFQVPPIRALDATWCRKSQV